jgi:hypothetical protein
MKNFFLVLLALASFLIAPDVEAQVSYGTVTVTPNAAAYVAGYCVGGVLTVPNMVAVGSPGGTIIIGVSIVDNTGTNASMDLMVFDRKPTGTYTDHAACTVATADQPYFVGIVPNTSFVSLTDIAGTTGLAQASPALPVLASNTAGTPPTTNALWVIPIMRGTPTYGASKALQFNFFAIPSGN